MIRSEKNSGSPSVPRNIGIGISRGEYIMFVDSDDAITETALDENYTVAKKFNADVVHCEKFYRPATEKISANKKNLVLSVNMATTDFVDKPTLMTEDIALRIQNFSMGKFDWSTWTNFVRRDFIAKSNIKFFDSQVCEDTFFSLQLLCLAKIFVLTPTVHYIYRLRNDSVTKSMTLSAQQRIERWGDFFFRGIPTINKFMNQFSVFKENPQYKYAVYDLLMQKNLGPILEIYQQIPAPQLDEIICAELDKVEDKTALTAFLFSRMNVFNLGLIQQSQK